MDHAATGQRIRHRRIKLGMTQAALAEACEVTPSFLRHIERDTRKASLETLLKLSDALGESPDGLARGVHMEACLENDSTEARVLNAMMRILYEHAEEWVREMEAGKE